MKSTLKQLIKEINPDYQYFYSDFKDTEEEVTDVELEFVKLGKSMSNKEVFALLEEKGLRMSTFIELANAVKKDFTLFEKGVFTLRDKNEYLVFFRWHDELRVLCDRRDIEFYDSLWVCGVRKPLDSGKLGTLVPLALEKLVFTLGDKKFKIMEVE